MSETTTSVREANMNRAIGVAVIVIGALVLVGQITLGWVTPLLGVILLTIGILQLTEVLEGGNILGAAFLFIGLLLLLGGFGLTAAVGRVVDVVAGTLLVVLGVLRLT